MRFDYYKGAFGYAVFMIFVYPIGIPLMYFYLLYSNREEIMNRGIVAPINETLATTNADTLAEEDVNPLHDNADHVDAQKRARKLSIGTVATPTEKQPIELSREASRLAFLFEAYEPKYWCVLCCLHAGCL
jgi:hypothetical protein